MNKIHAVRSVRAAEALLEQLGLNWVTVVTPKLSEPRDPIANQYRETYGNAVHFVNAKSRAFASFVQETNALVIYDRAKPISEEMYRRLVVRRKDGIYQVPNAHHRKR